LQIEPEHFGAISMIAPATAIDVGMFIAESNNWFNQND
jgi:hypothetical protein